MIQLPGHFRGAGPSWRFFPCRLGIAANAEMWAFFWGVLVPMEEYNE